MQACVDNSVGVCLCVSVLLSLMTECHMSVLSVLTIAHLEIGVLCVCHNAAINV